MHDFTAEFLKCVKFHGEFTERVSQIHGKFTGPTDVISRCCAVANEEISEQRIFTTLSQDSQCQLLSAEVRHMANSNIRTKAADTTLELSEIKPKALKFTKKHGFHKNQRFSRKVVNFTKNVTAVKS